jgi:levansucrase
MTAPARWTGDHIEALDGASILSAPLLGRNDFAPVAPDLGVWDAWPLQDMAGRPLSFSGGRELWMALGAARFADPEERHGHARIHLLLRDGTTWRHLGPAMPDGFSPGSREWSGSAVVSADGTAVTLYFTAAGRRGEAQLTFEQRIFSAMATLDTSGDTPRLSNWRGLAEIVTRDPAHYMATTGGPSEVGKIKAFRDPAFFRDPLGGGDYLLFAGSRAGSPSAYNGVIGIARREWSENPSWKVLPPILCADTLNNELERPHVVFHDGLFYLFWSTQRHVFAPSGPAGPTGLYGMVSDKLFEGWRPVNGSGLVLANPDAAPAQAYSWFVLPDLSVTSFVDNWRGEEIPSFGGTFAPFMQLHLAGDKAWIAR